MCRRFVFGVGKKKKKRRERESWSRQGSCERESEGAPRASERLINPNSAGLNEVLITLADSLKARRRGPRRLMLTYMIVWSEGKSFHCSIKLPCVCVCGRACSRTVVSSTHFPHRASRPLCVRGSSLRTGFPRDKVHSSPIRGSHSGP